jgi:lysophospholipase L1-like esterase
VSPVSGTLATNAGQQITVSVNNVGLQPGTSNAVITITDPAAANSPRTVSVSLSILSTNPVLAIFGSSVAKGWASSGMTSGVTTNGSWTNSYSYFITRHLTENGGYFVTNVSTPGDNTATGISRFPSYVVPRAPTYVLLGYSLGNEGLAGSTDPSSSAISSNFLANLLNLVGLCRTNGYYPVISSVYPRGDYTADNYAKLKQAHLVINTWDVPSLNLLTPVDDGTGRWISGYWADGAHPNDAGYAEFYYAFVPSLFDAVAAGRTNRPALGSATNFARLTYNAGVNAPLTFTPSNTVHSFTTAFRLRTSATGTDRGGTFGRVTTPPSRCGPANWSTSAVPAQRPPWPPIWPTGSGTMSRSPAAMRSPIPPST